jgi:sugar lactone lactonase YvrE
MPGVGRYGDVPSKPVYTFPSPGRFPEGIAISRRGEIFLGVQPTAEIVRLTYDGSTALVADLDEGAGFLLGLASDRNGDLFAALPSFMPETHGVWRVRRDGSSELYASLPVSSLPNAFAFDRHRNLYVTDTFLGAVWRVRPDGEVTQWLQHALLVGTGEVLGIAAGANGIAYHRGDLYVANFDRGTIVRIPILPDDAPGVPSVHVQHPTLVSADDIRFDVRGNLYVAVNRQNSLVKISRDREPVVLVDDLDLPASLAFGHGRARRSLFVTNFGFGGGAHLVRVDVGVPGPPLH